MNMSAEVKPTGWEALKTGTSSPKSVFTKEMARDIFEKSKKARVESPICAVVYGYDGTGKTGACMDCRTEEERKAGKMVIIFDLDDGAGPIKEQYWENDDNIVCLSPIEMFDNGDVDYLKTYDRLRALVAYVKTEIPQDKIKAVIVDGLDTLKKLSEWAWKLSEGMQPTDAIKDIREWQHRNWRYNNIIIPIKNMNCDRYFITHLKEIKKFKKIGESSQLVTDRVEPDWLEGTPGMMYQRILCSREQDPNTGVVTLKAKMEKSKHDLSREGKEFVIATVNPRTGESKWESAAFHKLMMK